MSSKALTVEFLAQVLRLAPHLSCIPWDSEHVFLVGDDQQFLLTGAAYAAVVPRIDGRTSVADLAEQLAPSLPPSETLYALVNLRERGYVTAGDSFASARTDGFWTALGHDPAAARAKLATTAVSVRGPDAAGVSLSLRSAGIRVEESAPLRVVLTDDYLSDALEEENARALHAGLHWMPAKLSGPSPWVGPVFSPPGPCWECLASRLRLNRSVQSYVDRRGGGRPALPVVDIDASRAAACAWLALCLVQWIVDESRSPLGSSLGVMGLVSLETRLHRVIKRPQCVACGDPRAFTRRAKAPVRLKRAPRQFSDDGGFRVQTPEETFDRLAHHISPISGLVASIEPFHGRGDALRPVFVGTYRTCPAAEPPGGRDFHRHSAGKGRTTAQSRASALCEALERQGYAHQGDEPTVRARISDLGGDAVHPDSLLNFSAAQRRAASSVEATCDPRLFVAAALDDGAEIAWTPAWSLTRDRRRWLPLAYCYAQIHPRVDADWCPFDPNGHAAGNCLEEAVLQAVLELIERDSVGIWWYNRVPRPAVDLASFGVPYFGQLAEHYRSLGWPLWVLDITTDLGVPCFVALARAVDGRYAVGFGCHLDARLGVQRALTELNQLFRPAEADAPFTERDVGNVSYLVPADVPPVASADFDCVGARDLREDVLVCVERLARAGLETIVIDHSRPDVELSTAKVVVPGLRHIWPRFGPGRLYDVPVERGWLSRARAENELNSRPLLL